MEKDLIVSKMLSSHPGWCGFCVTKDGNILGLPQPPAPAPGAMGVFHDSTVFRGRDMEVYMIYIYIHGCFFGGVIQNSTILPQKLGKHEVMYLHFISLLGCIQTMVILAYHYFWSLADLYLHVYIPIYCHKYTSHYIFSHDVEPVSCREISNKHKRTEGDAVSHLQSLSFQ